MKKIYDKITLKYNEGMHEYEQVESLHYYVNELAPIVECKGGSGGGGGGTTQTIQKSDPWSGQQPYLTKGFAEAQKIYNAEGPKYYPGEMVAPFSPETNQALEMQAQRARSGSPIQQPMNNQLMSTLNGDYLYGGAGFNNAVDAATRRIMPQIDSTFELSGRTGSGLAQTAKTQAIADAFANQYGQERQNQIRSMLYAPQAMAQDYQDIGRLSEVGAQKEAFAQEKLAADINKYNFEQGLPRAKLADYMNMIQGNYGGTSATSTQGPSQSRNRTTGILGGALSGASAGSMAGPWGAGIGGILGALGGMF